MESLSPDRRKAVLERAIAALQKRGQLTEQALVQALTINAAKQNMWDLDKDSTLQLVRQHLARKQESVELQLDNAPDMTQVGVSIETRQRLREIGMKGQTYDEIIRRLIDSPSKITPEQDQH